MFYAAGFNEYDIDMTEKQYNIFKRNNGHVHNSIHAEENAINNLKISEKTKKVNKSEFFQKFRQISKKFRKIPKSSKSSKFPKNSEKF